MEHKILIIDDSEDDILLTQMVLAKLGLKIRTEPALSGELGLAILKGGGPLPSLVLLDLKMPGLDGLDVLREIRSDDRLRGIPVIVVTHSDLESDREACYDAGANGFLHKSVDMDRFAVEIRKALEEWMKPASSGSMG
ncbi:MAG: response regulator [Nitrospirota bacterium]